MMIKLSFYTGHNCNYFTVIVLNRPIVEKTKNNWDQLNAVTISNIKMFEFVC